MKKLLLILSLACLTLANTSFAQQGLDQTTLPAGHRMAMGQDIEVYGNEQYVVLEDGSSGIYGALYKNDGTTLTQITLPGSLRMAQDYEMEVYDSDLFVVLEDGSSGVYGALHKYDGTTFTQITLPGSLRMAAGYDIRVYGNDLYVVLEDGFSGIYGALYKYDGTTFAQITLPGSLRMAQDYDIEIYANNLMLVLEDGFSGIYGALYEFDGTTLAQKTLPGSLRMAAGYDMEVYNNDLHIVLEDGSSGIYGALHKYDGTTFAQITLPGSLRMAQDYDIEIYANNLMLVLEDGFSGINGALYEFNGTTFTQKTFPGALRMAADNDMGVYNCQLYFVLEDGSSGIYGALYNYNGAYTCVNNIETVCNSYISPSGINYTSSTMINEVICREIYSIDLTIINSATAADTRTECNSYTWIDGNNYTSSNNTATYNIAGAAANGCDSLVTLDLTIVNSATGTDTRTECNSYTWIDGNNYTSSNNSAIFNIVGGAANGCDSLVTLDLTIANSTSGTDVITACGSDGFEIPNNGIDDDYDGNIDEYLGYQWIDNNYYTASNNTATWIETNAAGCDSTVALDLTILPPFVTEEDVITACDSYTWIDGTTYTSSSYGLAYFSDVNGCDSVLGFLDLTINSVSDLTASTSGLVITANNIDATYQWLDCDNSNAIIPGETGQSYTAITNGNYAVELTENGCVDTTACVSITSVGVLENTFGDEFAVYPNPTNGNFSINLGAIYESLIVSITDISGKLIDSKTITQSQVLNLNIKEPAGLYMVSVQAGDKKANIRLIKE